VPETGRDNERGFTLIELMVVVLIVAILLAIAVPTFLGARTTANDRATQANVRNAFTTARIYYNGPGEYTDDVTAMTALEPSITWTNSPLDASSPDRAILIKVYDVPAPRQTVIVAGRTRQGRCFYLKDVMGGTTAGTFYERQVGSSATCDVPTDPDSWSWTDSWSR
jgi:type IV pilus assembly protein PilA